MKNIVKKFSLLLLATFTIFWSCDDFIEKEPYYATPIENAVGSYENLQIAMTAVYNHLTDLDYLGKNFILSADIRGEDCNLNVDNSNRMTSQYDYTMTSGSGDANNAWGIMYRVVNQLNYIITNIDLVEDGTQEERDHLKGEALALRAMVHFDLVRLFAQTYSLPSSASDVAVGTPDGNGGHGGIPIITSITDDPFTFFPSRSTVKEVYDQVLSDLDASIPLMGENGPNYMGANAAIAIRARVKLYKQDWAGAAEDATTIINSGDYSLLEPGDYIGSWAKENTVESIFELALNKVTYLGTTALGYMYDTRGYGDLNVSNALLALYEAEDIRATTAEGEPDDGPPSTPVMFYETNGFTYTNKFPGRDGTAGLDNVRLLRLSEMYLIRAEANFEAGSSIGAAPLDDINSIREKRNASLFTTITATDIQEERRRELCFEGHRVYDITRRGEDLVRGDDYWAAQSITFPNTSFIYPIPDAELDVNVNLEQNKGYE